MAEAWERWANRGDHTVVYEARKARTPAEPEGYEFRRPGGEVLGVMDAGMWEAICEREVTDDGGHQTEADHEGGPRGDVPHPLRTEGIGMSSPSETPPLEGRITEDQQSIIDGIEALDARARVAEHNELQLSRLLVPRLANELNEAHAQNEDLQQLIRESGILRHPPTAAEAAPDGPSEREDT